jgi:hypothetical protein
VTDVPLIEVEGVSYSYGATPALLGVSSPLPQCARTESSATSVAVCRMSTSIPRNRGGAMTQKAKLNLRRPAMNLLLSTAPFSYVMLPLAVENTNFSIALLKPSGHAM